MKYTQIPTDAFKQIQLNAGILATGFTPDSGAVTGIVGATTGGINFTATPTYSDYGDDIDNCPKNMKELKKLDSWEAKMSGTFVTVSPDAVERLIGAATTKTGTTDAKITVGNDLPQTKFADIWWIGDYGESDGYVAVRLINALSTGGFQIQSTDKAKGRFAFEFTGHYSMSNQDEAPFEIYIGAGEA